jgi:hypothetical protein
VCVCVCVCVCVALNGCAEDKEPIFGRPRPTVIYAVEKTVKQTSTSSRSTDSDKDKVKDVEKVVTTVQDITDGATTTVAVSSSASSDGNNDRHVKDADKSRSKAIVSASADKTKESKDAGTGSSKQLPVPAPPPPPPAPVEKNTLKLDISQVFREKSPVSLLRPAKDRSRSPSPFPIKERKSGYFVLLALALTTLRSVLAIQFNCSFVCVVSSGMQTAASRFQCV